MDAYRREQCDGVAVWGSLGNERGYERGGVQFLLDYPEINGVEFRIAGDIDISAVHERTDLRWLYVAHSVQPLDLTHFEKLTDLALDFHTKITFPKRWTSLERLDLSRFNPKSRDLTTLPEFPNLTHLKLTHTRIQSVSGIERSPELRELSIYDGRTLEDLAPLQAPKLRALSLSSCRNVDAAAHAVRFPELKRLQLTKCAPLPSLQFLNRCPALRTFSFVDTDVIDGNLEPLIRLDHVGIYPNRRHFSHTDTEIDALISERREREQTLNRGHHTN
jgi:hypothetical protein